MGSNQQQQQINPMNPLAQFQDMPFQQSPTGPQFQGMPQQFGGGGFLPGLKINPPNTPYQLKGAPDPSQMGQQASGAGSNVAAGILSGLPGVLSGAIPTQGMGMAGRSAVGAGTGALSGLAAGGPIGAGMGGLAGLLGGLSSGKDGKKRQVPVQAPPSLSDLYPTT